MNKSVWVYYSGEISSGFDKALEEIANSHGLKWYGSGISTDNPPRRDNSFDYTDDNSADTFINEIKDKFGSQLIIERKISY